MFTGISITCFTASYAVALLLELSRLLFRSGVRGAVMLGFAAAGLVAHTLFLVARAAQTPARTIPLSGWFDWFLVAAWVLVLVYLYLTVYHPQNPIGLFLLPLVLCLIGVGYLARNAPAPSAPQAAAAWLWIHVLGLLLGTVAVLLGFAAGAMYLLQSSQLKHKRTPTAALRLPSLEWLARLNGRALVVSALLVTIGYAAGLVNNAHRFRGDRGGLPWSDPVIWITGLLVVWLLTAIVFNAVYRPSRQGRKVAYLTLVSFVLLVLTLAVVLFVPSAHPMQRAESNRPRATSSPSPVFVGYAQRTSSAEGRL